MLVLDNKDKSLKDVVEQGLSTIQSVFSYLLIPIALPLVFVQECLAWLREKLGLNNRSMEGKVVLITGASSGIGETLAHTFYKAGCRIILASRRRDELERVKDDLVRSKSTGNKVYVPAVLDLDLSDLKSIPGKAKAALAIYEGIDILINNAGILHTGTVLETELDVDRRIMDVNYFGTLSLTKVIGNSMKEKRSGHIVFMGSVQAKIALPLNSAYGASKHALQAAADSLRAEVCDDGIEVTCINPGYVKTNLAINSLTGNGSKFGRTTKNISTGMDPEYVAERTIKAVKGGEKDVVIAPLMAKLGIFLRYMNPWVFFLLMKRMGREYKMKAEKHRERQGQGS